MLNCDQIQAAISARLDGEPMGLEDDVVDAHVANCPQCQRFLEESAEINRNMNLRESPLTAPDLSEVILAGVEPEWRKQAAARALHTALARVAMAILGVAWVATAVNLLVQSSAFALDDPLAAQAVAMRCALGFGLFFASWQPRVVGGLLPAFGALAGFSFGFGMSNILLGELTADATVHLTLLVLSVIVLAWAWVSTKGWPYIQTALRSLSSSPV